MGLLVRTDKHARFLHKYEGEKCGARIVAGIAPVTISLVYALSTSVSLVELLFKLNLRIYHVQSFAIRRLYYV